MRVACIMLILWSVVLRETFSFLPSGPDKRRLDLSMSPLMIRLWKNVPPLSRIKTRANGRTSRFLVRRFTSQPIHPLVEISPADHGTTALENFETMNKLVVKALQKEQWTTPTTIQAHGIPLLLDKKADIMASSQTGSGKSLMFCLPLVQTLLDANSLGKEEVGSYLQGQQHSRGGAPRALILSPTRELAIQTSQVLRTVCQHIPTLRISLATGGSNVKQQRQQLATSNIIVGTPGRILQFVDERQLFLGQNLKFLVVDETDRMLDLSFEEQLTRIARMIRSQSMSNSGDPHQTILCSATFPSAVQRVASEFLRPDYYFISVGRVGSTHKKIQQAFEWTEDSRKEKVVVREVQKFRKRFQGQNAHQQGSVIVFTNTKEDAERYGKAFHKRKLPSRVIHGDKSQSERNQALRDFGNQKIPILVATNVAARGIDIASIGLVVQADAPSDIDTYTHRVGRTGRAGASGKAVTLLNGRSLAIASDLVELLQESGQDTPPAWLVGMAHVAKGRQLEEERQLLNAGGTSNQILDLDEVKEEYSEQDFRRNAVDGSYGADRDTSYRSFEHEAYFSGSESTAEFIEEQVESTSTKSQPSVNSPRSFMDTFATEEFCRSKPSQKLLEHVENTTGVGLILDEVNQQVLDALSCGYKNQKLRFEYLGMFPFRKVVHSLVKPREATNDFQDMTRILMVAEKPSIAKAIADALSGRKGPRQRRGISRALPIYQFVSSDFMPIQSVNDTQTPCLVSITSVVGHIFSLSFDQKNQSKVDPNDFFHFPVVKTEEATSSKLRVVDHLRALAGDSDHLVLWLDCDPEGENIAHEVIAVTRRAMQRADALDTTARIHRAKFSAITPQALRDAYRNLKKPDAALSRSVDARQELDLRVGVALTRLLTWKCVGVARRKFDPSTRLISYGPCQTPALSLCVDRAREIKDFQSKRFWEVKVQVNVDGQPGRGLRLKWKIPTDEEVPNNRERNDLKQGSNEKAIIDNATFKKTSAEEVVMAASEKDAVAIVSNVEAVSETKVAPLALNTVALLEAGSKAMGMSPKQVMTTAEKLYSAGLISYPRTETTKYDPTGFDVRSVLRAHTQNELWGKSVSYLLRTKYSKSGKPPSHGFDAGDHPPITPLKAATRAEVGGGAAWMVYEFIVRNFLGSLHNEISYTRYFTTLRLESPNTTKSHEFVIVQATVDSLGFGDVCRWALNDIGVKGSKDDQPRVLSVGQRLPIQSATMEERETRPPRFLQEYELIRLMDQHRIGTDASMAVHVSNIIDRGYVTLCDETGDPLRSHRPRRPGGLPKQLPRQIGRYMVPTSLGISLLNLFGSSGEETSGMALLSKPAIRRQMEEEVKQIATGCLDKDSCLATNLEWFERHYLELANNLADRQSVDQFGSNLSQTRKSLKGWLALGAFEPKPRHSSSRAEMKTTPKKRARVNQRRNSSSPQAQKAGKARPRGGRSTLVHSGHSVSKTTTR